MFLVLWSGFFVENTNSKARNDSVTGPKPLRVSPTYAPQAWATPSSLRWEESSSCPALVAVSNVTLLTALPDSLPSERVLLILSADYRRLHALQLLDVA